MRKIGVALAAVFVMGAAVAAAKPQRVLDVKSVTAKLQGTKITIKAKGEVGTPGFTNPQLVQIAKTSTTLTFEFVAEPPTGIVLQVVTPIGATKTTPPLKAPFPKKVTVVTKTNSMTVTVTR